MSGLRLVLLLILPALAGCQRDEDERRCLLAVKSLAAAPESHARAELDKVLAFGRYALPDIEQEFHAASRAGKLRLLEALSRLGEPEARPFLLLVARADEDPTVRRRARLTAAQLRR